MTGKTQEQENNQNKTQKKVTEIKNKNFLPMSDLFPDAKNIFAFKQESLKEIKENALIILDTNILLESYRGSVNLFNSLMKIFTKLKKKEQLFLPSQVAREFAKNRSGALAEQMNKWNLYEKAYEGNFANISKITVPKDNIFFSSYSDRYKEFEHKKQAFQGEFKKLQDFIHESIKPFSHQVGEDPVSIKYREIFTEETILEDPACWKNLEEFQKEKEKRYAAKIPPGYMDKEKGNDGGDLIIWKSILEHAKGKEKDCIFVTNDAKEDWFHKNEQILIPRIELLEEFRQETNGKTLHIIHLEKLLELFGASEEVKKEAIASQNEEVMRLREDTSKVSSETKSIDWHARNDYFLTKIEALKNELAGVEESLYRVNVLVDLYESTEGKEDREYYFACNDKRRLENEKKSLEKRIEILMSNFRVSEYLNTSLK